MTKATLKEIVNVMIKDMTPHINKQRSRKFLNNVIGLGSEYSSGAIAVAVLPYVIPSFCAVIADDNTGPVLHQTRSQERAYDSGIWTGLVGVMGQGLFYWHNPEYLPILAVTNTISGLYEWGKNAKKRIEGE